MLIGLLTDFRGYLASGQWLAPEIFPYCFCHADFVDDADFSLWKFLVSQISQISQITQIFLRGSFFISQISQITQIFLRGIFSILRGICNDRIGRLRVNP